MRFKLRRTFPLVALLFLLVGCGNASDGLSPKGVSAMVHITEFSVPTPHSTPESLINGPDSNEWFVESDASKVGRITSTGTISEFSLPSATQVFLLGQIPIFGYRRSTRRSRK